MPYLILIILATLISCSPPAPEITENPVSKPRLVGRVASIPSDAEFALLEIYGGKIFANGTTLLSFNGDRSANLQITGERNSHYAAADIRSGDLQVGDAVYLNLASPTKELPAATPPTNSQPKSVFDQLN